MPRSAKNFMMKKRWIALYVENYSGVRCCPDTDRCPDRRGYADGQYDIKSCVHSHTSDHHYRSDVLSQKKMQKIKKNIRSEKIKSNLLTEMKTASKLLFLCSFYRENFITEIPVTKNFVINNILLSQNLLIYLHISRRSAGF